MDEVYHKILRINVNRCNFRAKKYDEQAKSLTK